MPTKSLAVVVLAAYLCCSNVAIASPSSEALGACMADSLTGKERKNLAQWIFFAIAAHPEIRSFANVSSQDQVKIDQSTGQLITRLLTENCAPQVRAALQQDGNEALNSAFETVGKVAMQELMTDKDVVASISGYAKYLDEQKIRQVLDKK